MADKKTLSGIKTLLARHGRFVLTFHRNPDGDALASAFLFGRMLEKKGKDYLIVSEAGIPRHLSFFSERFPPLPPWLSLPRGTPLKEKLPGTFRDAALVIMDSSNPGRTGLSPEDLAQFPAILNIDHHSDNSGFGSVNLVEPKATSIGEILFGLCRGLGIRLDTSMAEMVYVSLYSDTVGFSQNNTSETARSILGEILKLHVGFPALNRELRKKTWNYLRLSGGVFSRLKLDDVAAPKVLWSSVTMEDLKDNGLGYEDLDGVIDEISFTGQAQIVFLLKELKPGDFKVSIRCVTGYNVKKVAFTFGGGGHDSAAGFEITGTIEDCAKRIIAAVRGT